MLDIVNNDTVNMRVQVFLEIMTLFPLDMYPEVGLLDYTTVLF